MSFLHSNLKIIPIRKMLFLLLLLLALSLIIVIHITVHKIIAKTLHYPPGPPRLPFIGNLHQFDTNNTHLYLWKLSKIYGPIMLMKLGCIQTLVISSAKLAKEVMKTHDSIFASRPKLIGQQKLSYNGLDMAFSPLNDYLKEMRKLCVVHLFSIKQVQSFRPIREDEVSRMVGKLSKLASLDEVVNLSEITMKVMSSFITRVAFGKRYDEEGFERRRFDKLLSEAQAVMTGFYVSDCFPLLGWIDKLSGIKSILEKNFQELDLFYQELIDEHLSLNRPKSMEGDILDILLKLLGGKSSSSSSSSSSLDLTLDNIKGVLMNIFIAGTDTSASTIVWAMTALMKAPQVMEKVQEEIRNLIGNKDLVDDNDIQKLSYLKAVVKETLRLYPPSPLLVPRETTERCIINGYEIRPKTLVFINAWAIGRDPDYWENPNEFLPQRFLNSKIDFKGQDFGLIPFGSGRRMCPGISMGVAMVEIVLANLLYLFDWKLPHGMKMEDIDTNCLPGITMHKKDPLCLVANRYA